MTRLYRTRVRHPPLLVPPSRVRAMLRYKPRWVPIPDRGPRSAEWPEFSLAEWRARRRAEAAALSLARRVDPWVWRGMAHSARIRSYRDLPAWITL